MKTSLMLKTPPVSFPELCKCLPPAHPRLGGFLNACVILPSLGWKHCEQKDEEKWRKKKEKQRLTQEAFPGLSFRFVSNITFKSYVHKLLYKL